MKVLPRLNRLRWFARLPIKWVVFGLTTFVVCYPHPRLFLTHVARWRNPNILVEPDAPELQALVAEISPAITPDLAPKTALARVERFVYDKVPYDWDWNTWGMADYLPSVAEVMAKGREDCDGRAVVAASLLARLGFNARLVTNFAHVWVKTDVGETMGPAATTAIEATDRGLRINWTALTELPKSLAYGVAVFPLAREAVILALFWLMMLGAESSAFRSGVALALFGAGVCLIRCGGANYYDPTPWLQWTGAAIFAGGCLVTLRHVRPVESNAPAPTVGDPQIL